MVVAQPGACYGLAAKHAIFTTDSLPAILIVLDHDFMTEDHKIVQSYNSAPDLDHWK